MLLPLADLDEGAVRSLLEEQYGVRPGRLRFEPVGEDSWAYRSEGVWVSIRRDLRGHVPEAYLAANELRRLGLDFVLAPLLGADGRASHSIGGLPVVVFPYVEAAPVDPRSLDRSDLERIVEMLSTVHQAATSARIPVEDFELSFDPDLDEAMRIAAGERPDRGPYGARLQGTLSANGEWLGALRDEYRNLAAACRSLDGEGSLTHGEPIPSNLLIDAEGRLLIGDWGELAWGPPERDWAHIARTLPVTTPSRREVLRLYEIRWMLSEIAEYTTVFAGEHEDDVEAAAMWGRLMRYLPRKSH